MDLIASVVLGILGWKIADRLRFPAPAIIGPMLSVALAASFGVPVAAVPGWTRILAQSLIGGFIGHRIDRDSLRSIGSTLPAMAITLFWYVAGTAGIGFLVGRWAGIDLRTAILGTVPGGVSEMTALAFSMNADVAFVASIQTVRVLAANLVMPVLAGRGKSGDRRRRSPEVHDELADARRIPEAGVADGLPETAAALAGGALFTLIRVPAGGVVGAMVAVAAVRLAGVRRAAVPVWLRTPAQIALGVSVGAAFDVDTLARLGSSAPVILFATAATVASALVLALVLNRLMGFEMRTAILASSPGGLSLMAVVAEEIGADGLTVGLFHLVRLVWIILATPLFLGLLG